MTVLTWGEQETKFFFELTPDRILDAVETSGVRCTGRCLPLNSMENRVYEVEIEVEDSSTLRSPSDAFRVIKFYRPGRWNEDQLRDEHQFLLDLTSAEVPVIAPVKLSDGDTLGKVEGIDVWYCVYPKQGGRIPSELGNDQLLQVGRLLARLHNVGSTKTATSRVTIDPQSYGLNNLNYLLEAELIPEHISTQYCDLVREICELTQPWFKNLPVQRIHGDCHLGNLIWGSAGPFWVDFDDMLQGPPVQDLWLLVPGRDEYAQSQMRVLLEGYEQMRDFDHRTLKLIEPLRALRFIHFSAWIGMRWKDPAFPRVFPEYGTEKYWTEQVSDLQQQLRLIRERISAEEYL